jgi:4-amino-4-deoxy-L-arabinose transferase-like glycosyltransferase
VGRSIASNPLLVIGAVFLIALGGRLAARDVIITADEDNWMSRSGGFAFGLTNGQLGRTYQNGHPGVTTMWISTLTLGPQRMITYSDRASGQRFVTRVPGFWQALVDARLGFVVATAMLVAAIAAIVWRLAGVGAAAAVGLMVGLEPFPLAISQLVHMDAVLAFSMGGAALAAAMRWIGRGGIAWMLVCGVLTGLAALSKSPAAYLAVFVPLGSIASLWFERRHGDARSDASVRSVVIEIAVWALAAAATIVALWPATWVLGIPEVAGRVLAFLRETGGQPHEAGTYFWGEPRADPGPWFYPVALFLRLSPAVTLGFVLVIRAWGSVEEAEQRLILVLGLFAVGFLAMMTLGAKKFDRYILPIFPAIAIISALGWLATIRDIRTRTGQVVAVIALVGGCVAPLWWSYPYFISHYNSLAGGPRAAEQLVMVGNGEGLDQVAAWLNERSGADDAWVVAHSYDVLQAMMRPQGEPLRDRIPGNADYIVLYKFQTQIGHSPRVVAELFGRREPELTVRIGPIDYAWVFRGPHLGAR